MKLIRNYLLLFSLASVLIISCEEDEVINPIPIRTTPSKLTDKIPYRMLVRSSNELGIRLDEGYLREAQVYLTTLDDTVKLAEFTPQLPNKSYLTASIEYSFSNEPIDLLFNIKKEGTDTLYQVPILNYTHNFKSEIKKEKLIEFGDYLYKYELSPSRKSFFYTIHPSDGFSNAKLYQYFFRTGENKLLEEDFKGTEIRAVSDDEIYYVTKFRGGEYLNLDTALLIRKNYITGVDKLVAEVSHDYGRFSRVIEDRMLVVRPWLTEPNCYLINTITDELQEVTFNYPMMLEPRLDHIWLGNYKVLPNTELQSFPMAENNNFSIIAYDEKTEEIQGVLYDYTLSDYPYFNKLRVYRNGNILFQEKAWQKKFVSLVTGTDHSEKPLIVHQKYFDKSNGAKDGFYFYSQQEPGGRLLLSEPEDFNSNFWVDDKSFISVKLDGLYLFTLPESL